MPTPEASREPALAASATPPVGHRNALGFIRLVLAGLVIVSHAFPLGAGADDPLLAVTRRQESLGTLAVLGFFGVSGFLITRSAERNGVLRFLWHRVLRIFPAFWAVLVVAALVVGPAAVAARGGSIAAYLSPGDESPWRYLIGDADLTIRQWGAGGVFLDTPYGRTVGYSVFNGSLWTLRWEWLCYVLVALLLASTLLVRARIVIPVIAVALLVLEAAHIPHPAAFPALHVFGYSAFSHLGAAFFSGATIAVYGRRLPTRTSIALLAGAAGATTLLLGGFAVVGPPAVAYLVLFAAARLPSRLDVVGARDDYSYGLYLWGFLVEQVLAATGVPVLGPIVYVALALLLSAGAAWLSWHGIERRALALKDVGLGRRQGRDRSHTARVRSADSPSG